MRQLLKLQIFWIEKWEFPNSMKHSLVESQNVILRPTYLLKRELCLRLMEMKAVCILEDNLISHFCILVI